jgi:hypothetical protein
MKIKHWQGYGSVNAVKIKDKKHTLHVKVSGNHEYGLERNDMYDLYNWLIKRFDKSIQTYRDFDAKNPTVVIKSGYENDIETCDYCFDY